MITLKIAAILACALLTDPAVGPTRSFADYPVNIARLERPKLRLRSHQIGRRYRTVITAPVREQGINFAGHYTVAKWGCGSSCLQFAIINLKSGRIFHEPSIILTRGLEFRPDSNLLIANPVVENGFFDQVQTTYYVWNGSSLRKLGAHEQRPN